MDKRCFLWLLVLMSLCSGCFTSLKNYDPNKKFPKTELQQDYSVLRKVLEDKHPALYWYTSRDSMNYYFDSLYASIGDSMTELQFGWKVLAPLTQKIHCGHTSFGMSRQWGKFIRDRRIPSFPLFVKAWGDTMVVTGSLNRKDSIIKRGTLITSINGYTNKEMISKIFDYLPMDGYADNVNYVRISGNFPYYHRNVYGIFKNYRVGYIDSVGREKSTIVPMFSPPPPDSTKKKRRQDSLKLSRQQIRDERRTNARSLEIDSSGTFATLSLHTFSAGEGRKLRLFMKRSFKKLRKQQVKNLVLDLRSNGGGDVGMYVLLTKYIRNSQFKVADTSYAIAKTLRPYSGLIRKSFFYNIGMVFMTKKKKDGLYHFGYYERHFFKPKKKNHYNGDVYVLISGPTFSASTLFCNAVKGQQNVKLVGEETGGGWHGNSGLMIPDITLPITKLRVRLPLFKLVQYNHVPKDGRGVEPDIFIPPTVEGVRQNIDRKMEQVKLLISGKAGLPASPKIL
ncbi:MAG: S41 family peptidase [Bacteroidota bacterium]